MCRWMAWHGQPVLIEELLFKTQHGIVDQRLHARMGAPPPGAAGLILSCDCHNEAHEPLPGSQHHAGGDHKMPEFCSSNHLSGRGSESR